MLTDHQAQKTEDIISCIKNKEKRLVLKGSAGVGKTFLTNILIKRFRAECEKFGTIYVTAPTHKALKVLRDKIEPASFIEFATIHSALRLQRKITNTGLETYVKSKYNPRYPPLQGCKLLIIDEASMLGSDILAILEEPEFRNILTVCIGDAKQIQPVNEENSPVFQTEWTNVELTEIVRQGKDNPIIDLSYNIMKIFHKEDNASIKQKQVKLQSEEQLQAMADKLANYGFDDIDNDGNEVSVIEQDYTAGFVYTNDRQRIVERLAEVNGSDELKYLAWTNKEVDLMNDEVRKKIYGNPKKIELGETIILSAPYGEHNNNDEIKIKEIIEQDYVFIVPNENTEFSSSDGIISIIESPMRDSSGNVVLDSNGQPVYPYGQVKLRVYRCNNTLLILHENSEAEFTKLCKEVNALCRAGLVDWKLFYWFKETVVDFKYAHASSVHKSQGSTFLKTIINVGEMNRNKNVAEKKRLFYTAITRASELVILYNVK